jgi:olfactory receptor
LSPCEVNSHYEPISVDCSFITTTNALLHSLMLLRLSFCRDLEIPHFFCELVHLMKMACSDTFVNNFLIYTVTVYLQCSSLWDYFLIYSNWLLYFEDPNCGGKI